MVDHAGIFAKAGQNFVFMVSHSHLGRICVIERYQNLIFKPSEVWIVPSQSGVISHVGQGHG